jgi:DnaJ family protein B protein 12
MRRIGASNSPKITSKNAIAKKPRSFSTKPSVCILHRKPKVCQIPVRTTDVSFHTCPDLLVQIQLMAEKKVETEQPRRRNAAPKVEEPKKAPEYTPEQLEAVKKINKCKDYYEILGVSKDATDSEIKKAYKKLALQFHPDKNKCPGAAEAFKAIGNAVAVLTDVEKRKHYDQFGPEDERLSARSYTNNYREFDADTTDEFFNMFFGGGFNGANVYVRRGGRWQRQNTGSQETHHTHHHREQNNYSAFVQLLPIILAIVLSMASSFFVSDPPYSLQANPKYPIGRSTANLRVPYYVKENFATEFQGSVRRLEMSVEEEYISNLRHACYREKNYRKGEI